MKPNNSIALNFFFVASIMCDPRRTIDGVFEDVLIGLELCFAVNPKTRFGQKSSVIGKMENDTRHSHQITIARGCNKQHEPMLDFLHS